MDATTTLAALFRRRFGQPPTAILPLPRAGSNRAYFRLTDEGGNTAVGVRGDDIAENRTFIYLARHFKGHRLPAPEIFGVSDDESAYLQEDLGTRSLYDALQQGREAGGNYNPDEIDLLRQTVRLLPHLQIEGGADLDAARLLSPARFSRRTVMFDLNYFKYCFLRPTDLPFDEVALEDDFDRLADRLLQADTMQHTFLYRDFQARNIMLPDGRPHIIDFQGGRIGPLHYDVASFLWQASARYPSALRELLIDTYLDELATLQPVDRTRFREQLSLFVFFRLLQVLGAYGLRGLFERKPYFLRSIPLALSHLTDLRADLRTDFPALDAVLDRLFSFDFHPFISPAQ